MGTVVVIVVSSMLAEGDPHSLKKREERRRGDSERRRSQIKRFVFVERLLITVHFLLYAVTARFTAIFVLKSQRV